MPKQDQWEEIGGGDLGEIWDYKVNETLQGIFVEKRANVGPNGSNIYTFEQPDGKRISVWGTALLDSRFSNLFAGEEVKVNYLGDEISPKTGRSYHNFSVYKRKP